LGNANKYKYVYLQVQRGRGYCGATAVVQQRLAGNGGRELKVVGLEVIAEQIDGRLGGQTA